jgi:hypothetical protein
MTLKPIRIEPYRWTGVNRDGTFKNEAGAVKTKKGVTTSAPAGGCGSYGCNCSPGHWISLGNARTKTGVVSGKTLYFKSRKDLLEYMKEHNLKGQLK